MKKIFSYILPMFAALSFASCSDLSSLENRVDSLESRVEALEKGVNKINERVEAVQKLVEGGTVSNVERCRNVCRRMDKKEIFYLPPGGKAKAC